MSDNSSYKYPDHDYAGEPHETVAEMRQRWIEDYELNKKLKVGSTPICPVCETRFVKKMWAQAFCGKKTRGRSNCKDKYWNIVNPRGQLGELVVETVRARNGELDDGGGEW